MENLPAVGTVHIAEAAIRYSDYGKTQIGDVHEFETMIQANLEEAYQAMEMVKFYYERLYIRFDDSGNGECRSADRG